MIYSNRPRLWITWMIAASSYLGAMIAQLSVTSFLLGFIFSIGLAIEIERGEFEVVAELQQGLKSLAGLGIIAILGFVVMVAADFQARQFANWLTQRITGRRFPPTEG